VKPKLIVFDVGETLIAETPMWEGWARWLETPASTLFAALGAVIAERRHHHDALRMIRPGLDVAAERAKREAAGETTLFTLDHLYPDTLPALHALASDGYRLAFCGNTPAAVETLLADLNLPADFIGSSANWGVEKPNPGFFHRIVELASLAPSEIAYVGDRIDNDILPALACGLQAFHIRRGPWGVIQARWPEARDIPHSISSLDQLAPLFART
jgi:HAD superfamily hydrolase (TIGR01549 family)